MTKEPKIESLEEGWVLTPPGYLNSGLWILELRGQEPGLPSHMRFFRTAPFKEADQEKDDVPKHYIVREDYSIGSKLAKEILLSIVDNNEGNGEELVKGRAEQLARREAAKIIAVGDPPYLGELVLQGKKYVLKKYER